MQVLDSNVNELVYARPAQEQRFDHETVLIVGLVGMPYQSFHFRFVARRATVLRRVPRGCNFRRRRASSTTYLVWSYPRWCLRQSRTVSKTMSANAGADCAFGDLPRTFARF